MNATTYTKRVSASQPRAWFAWLGLIAIGSAIAAIVADITVITLIEAASFLATSVSATAIGQHASFVDAALYLVGLVIAAIAFALHTWNLDHGRYRFGIFCLAAMAPVIFMLAGWDRYDPDQVPDFGFHMMLVYALSGLFPLAALALARGLSKIGRFWGVFSITLAVLWIVTGPIYAVTPETFEGLFQRIAFSLLLLWIAGIGVLLVRAGSKRAAGHVDLSSEGA